jgi:hypothetical protein
MGLQSGKSILGISNDDWRARPVAPIVGHQPLRLLQGTEVDKAFGTSASRTEADATRTARRSPLERAREEQAYYRRFWRPPTKRNVWKSIVSFLAPPIAALTAVMALLAYSMH